MSSVDPLTPDEAQTNLKGRPARPRRLSLLVLSLLAVLLLAEVIGRVAIPLPTAYFLRPPNSREELRLPTSLLKGVPAVARHVTNAQGVRGDAVGAEPQYRILALGGSTTACSALDAPQTWPSRLQAILAERKSQGHVWVGNAGKDGLNTRHHLVTMDRFVPQVPRLDAVILLAGINDFAGRLAQDTDYRPLSVAEILSDPVTVKRTFALIPAKAGLTTWYQRLGLWRLAGRCRALVDAWRRPTVEAQLAKARSARREARIRRQTLPDLEPSLREYERNLEAIIARGRSLNLRLIFVTQPVLWKIEGMPPAEELVLVFGSIGGDPVGATEWYTTEVLAAGMARYNERMREVCLRRGVECIDLAALLRNDATNLWDDCHFTIAGADKVARILSAHLLATPPLRQ